MAGLYRGGQSIPWPGEFRVGAGYASQVLSVLVYQLIFSSTVYYAIFILRQDLPMG